MKNNQPQSKTLDDKINYFAGLLGVSARISTKYIIPLVAGFYVGRMGGSHIEIEPATKVALLIASTAAYGGLAASLFGFRKLLGNSKSLKTAKLKYETMKKLMTYFDKPEKIKLRDPLPDIHLKKPVETLIVKPAMMTTLGYALGYASTCIN